MGIIAAVFVLILSVTGILLNHSHELGLDNDPIQSPLILGLYGVEFPAAIPGIHSDGRWFSQFGERLFIDGVDVAACRDIFAGVVASRGEWVVFCGTDVLLLTETGELIERIPAMVTGVPKKVGLASDGEVVLADDRGLWRVDMDQSGVSSLDRIPDNTIWSEHRDLPRSQVEKLRTLNAGHSINHERVVLDLHSGRLFGPWGVYLMDLMAIFMCVLAITGSWLWLRRKVRIKNK